VIVRGGTVVTSSGAAVADVEIADGRIVEVGPDLDAQADELDATGLHVLPGAVDAHVHFNDPGRADWEGVASGSAALVAGGGTCFVDMPLNAHPPTVDAAGFHAKREAMRASACDFALWGGLVPGNVDRLPELAALGVVGFKAFMSPSGIADFEAADDETLRAGMGRAAELGLPVAVHAESPAKLLPPAGGSWRDWCRSRPREAEHDAIEKALVFAEEAGCSLHVVHVSTGRGVRLVEEAQERGVDATCETCPHYLFLDEDDAEALGAVAKCAPPLRDRREQDDLWTELLAGNVLIVASDHSPAPPELKQGDASQAWGGISGCQSLLSLLLSDDRLDPVAVARLAATAPAVRFGLPGKGRIEPGADADLALVALGEPWTLAAEDLRYRHRHSPYVGRLLRARVVRTLVGGGAPGSREPRLVRPER
jgi:allantoinase